MERIVGEVSLAVVSWFFLFTLNPVYSDYQGDALSAFKTSCIQGGGDPNNVLQNWDSTLVNPCTWFHVTCVENRVTRVDLGNSDLSCQLVSELGQLNSLQYLELYQNKISGPIPDEVIGNLTSLVSLDLYSNKLNGSIPESVGMLSKLRFFRLNNNSLTGTIPTSLTAISSLNVVDLSYNNLSGDVPIDGSFSGLTPHSFAYNRPNLCYPDTNTGTCMCKPEIGIGTC